MDTKSTAQAITLLQQNISFKPDLGWGRSEEGALWTPGTASIGTVCPTQIIHQGDQSYLCFITT